MLENAGYTFLRNGWAVAPLEGNRDRFFKANQKCNGKASVMPGRDAST
jgi:hypothetical protein